MVGLAFSRRSVLASLTALIALPKVALADEVYDLEWTDLLPKDEPFIPRALSNMIDHDKAPMSSQQPASSGRRNDWNGKVVRLPGFIVPIDQKGTGVTAFILVPYVGACVHVPPPPANQLVFVTTNEPYEMSGLFEAVNVTGMFGTASTHTQLAQIGYALSADKIEAYKA